MTRYILIDHNSGFIWEEAFADSVIEACRKVDDKLDPQAVPYRYEETPVWDGNETYYVYAAPEGFRDITDGTDEEQIEAVENECRFVTAIVRTGGDADDDEEFAAAKEGSLDDFNRYIAGDR